VGGGTACLAHTLAENSFTGERRKQIMKKYTAHHWVISCLISFCAFSIIFDSSVLLAQGTLSLDQRNMNYVVKGSRCDNWGYITDKDGNQIASISLFARRSTDKEIKSYFDKDGAMVYCDGEVEIKSLISAGIYVSHVWKDMGRTVVAGYRYTYLRYKYESDADGYIRLHVIKIVPDSQHNLEYIMPDEDSTRYSAYKSLNITKNGMVRVVGISALPPLLSKLAVRSNSDKSEPILDILTSRLDSKASGTFIAQQNNRSATKLKTNPIKEAYQKVDPSDLSIDFQASMPGNIEWGVDGINKWEGGVKVKKFTVAGKPIELVSDDLQRVGKEVFIETRNYGKFKVRFNSNFKIDLWLKPSQEEQIEELLK
jgi:hypothetical protein